MIREKLMENDIGRSGKFRWRGNEISRIEGLSDAVFGFAITLLVVSLEVPKTFNELAETMHGFGAFLVSFILLFAVWFNQYKFFRRYGLKDTITVVLNGALLFVVLFYVYPLKFLFSFLIARFTTGHAEVRLPNGNVVGMIENNEQMASLMTIFNLGYLAVFGVFVLLFWHAYRRREDLELNELERFDTRESIQGIRAHVRHCYSFTRDHGGWRCRTRRPGRNGVYADADRDDCKWKDHGQTQKETGATSNR